MFERVVKELFEVAELVDVMMMMMIVMIEDQGEDQVTKDNILRRS